MECGLQYADPMPSGEDLEHYNLSYFHNAHGGMATSPDEDAFFSAMAALRLAHVSDYVRDHAASITDVLEVGPGAGHFASHWLRSHPLSVYHAVETDTTCHAALAQLGVRLVEPDGGAALPTFDLVVLSHVLEHVSDPKEFLHSILEGLRPGGVIFIEVPCNDWQHKALDEPHLLFFDKKPMATLLESLGLRDMQLSYHGRLISDLQADRPLRALAQKVRSRLIRNGVVFPFSRRRPGMTSLSKPLERAVIHPTQAHLEQDKPAWWLRALATKK